MDQKVKFGILGSLALILIIGMAALNRPTDKASNKPAGKKDRVEQGSRSKHTGGSLGSMSDASKKQTKSAAAQTTQTKDPLYGLPALTDETIDIAHEKPADMPAEAWDEYERKRYEMVQLKAYKFRETDPEKVVPIEISKAVPDAAKKYDVPPELLAALLMSESDGGHHDSQHNIEGGYGLMMLKESPQCNTLKEASQLLGVSPEELIYNQKLNVMGAAAVLRQYYDDALASGIASGEAWYMAVAAYSGRPQPELAQALADGVADYMRRGFEIDSDDGSGYYKQDPMTNPIFESKSKPYSPESDGLLKPPADNPQATPGPKATP